MAYIYPFINLIVIIEYFYGFSSFIFSYDYLKQLKCHNKIGFWFLKGESGGRCNSQCL